MIIACTYWCGSCAGTLGAIFVSMFVMWIIIMVLVCRNQRQIARRQQERAAAQAALGELKPRATFHASSAAYP